MNRVVELTRKGLPVFVTKMMVKDLDKTKCSNKFLGNNLPEDAVVNVKCYQDGTLDLRGNKGEYRIILEDENTVRYNFNRPLSDFQENIDRLRNAGFKPLAVSQMYFEDTWVFGTQEEALRAFRTFEIDENEKRIPDGFDGWWYGVEEFKEEVKNYESEAAMSEGSKVRIYWL